jgi:hypothetical protein
MNFKNNVENGDDLDLGLLFISYQSHVENPIRRRVEKNAFNKY